MREKLGIIFCVSGDARFLSHQDMMRLFARAIRRASLEVAYSQGYNPRLRLSLVLPRSVGVASRADLLVVDLDCPAEPARFGSRLAGHLPAGVELGRAFQLTGRKVPQPVTARYRLSLPPGEGTPLDAKIQEIMTTPELFVTRPGQRGSQSRSVDIRPYLKELQGNAGELSFWLSCGPRGSAKPAEILALLNLDTPANRARLLRTDVQYAGLDDGALNN